MSSFHLPPSLSPLALYEPIASTWTGIVQSYSPATIEFAGTLIVQLIFFWGPCAIYLSLDRLFPKFSDRHKIQPAPKQPTRSEIFHCLSVVLRNQVLSSTLHALLIYVSTKTGKGAFRVDASIPPLFEVVRDIVFSLLLREALFYYSHRILHHPRLYPKIHKIHHKFTAPVALAAQYAHPIEQIVANILPITIPPQLMHSHILTFWMFMAYELVETTTVHSGYDFFMNAAKMHDLHHEKFLIYFGAIGVLDWFHGTDGSRMAAKRKAKGAAAAKGITQEQVDAIMKETKSE
ncbi:hypothetical protein H072_6399 [Dactylellina haptotyla CBS 200.50]|uniref:Fatty acid hydroxylase domain-containing protein n=1 Tax=Dactylellina haptotyla (strain CBS 200.50) TaxID=1284197 RepID=S8AFN0_DACHA|nr:hypothetical protein H072_6399 [Dactylellina haptotyla CBS 200.50]